MHRTHLNFALVLGTLLLGLTLSRPSPAQEKPPLPQQMPDGAAGAPGADALIVPINGTQRVQMASKKKIVRVLNPKDTVIQVKPIAGDPTSVLVTGMDAGIARITLIDEAGARETLDIVVQLDVEYLRTLLVRAVPTSSVQILPGANNTIVLSGTVAHAEDIDVVMRTAISVVGGPERVVNALQIGGVQQVQLDVVVARVSRDQLRNMSFDWLNVGDKHVLLSSPGGAFVMPSVGITGSLPGNPVIQNSIGTPNGIAPNFFLGIFSPDQAFFGLLQALKTENLAKIMSKPSLIGQSGRAASLLDGGEQAVPVPAGLGQVGVQFEEFGTRLNFLPIVLGNGRIHLEVEPEISTLDPSAGTAISGVTVPGRLTQRLHTTVNLEDGQTLVLGGLIQHTVRGSTTKVPIVGELPFLGAAFSRKSFEEVETELIVMVTPHLVDAMSCDQAPKNLPGHETRSPDDFELFLEGIMEAPRGPRDVCPDGKHYVPAFKNGPTNGIFPCGGNGGCGHGACGSNGACGAPGCADSATRLHADAAPTTPAAKDTRPVVADLVMPPAAAQTAAGVMPTTGLITAPVAEGTNKSMILPDAPTKPMILPPVNDTVGSSGGQQ
jgi:pilus assembly protein CpaC